MTRFTLASALLAGLALATPQEFDLGAIEAAPEVATGPELTDAAVGEATATIYTDFVLTGAATAASAATTTVALASDMVRRDVSASTCGSTTATCTNAPYTPYYPALATSYTTDPALSASSTTTANQPCVTQPEDGTYCGFINPNDPCAAQPDGYGPVPTPDTDDAFVSYSVYHSSALAAPTAVPAADGNQYTQVFVDLQGSVSANSYMGSHTLQSYDVAACASFCDCTDLCTSFNLYIERDPSLNPSKNDSTAPTVWGYWCPNPPSMAVYRCTLWGSSIGGDLATNEGGWREDFHVVIAASNGYDKTNVTTPDSPTAPCGGGSSSSVFSTSSISTSSFITTTTTSSAVTTTTSSAVTTTTSSAVTTTTSSVVTTTTSSAVTSTSSSTSSSSSSSSSSVATSSPTSSKATSTSTSSVPTTTSKPATSSTSTKCSTTSTSAKPTPSTYIPPKPWGPPTNCGKKPMNAPYNWMGSQYFPGPFNPQVCSDYAFAQNAMNKAQGKKQACQMFNAAYLHKNGVPHGTYCQLYNQPLGTGYATGPSSFKSGRDSYECKQSWTWTLK